MVLAVEKLPRQPDYVLVDGHRVPKAMKVSFLILTYFLVFGLHMYVHMYW